MVNRLIEAPHRITRITGNQPVHRAPGRAIVRDDTGLGCGGATVRSAPVAPARRVN